MHSRTEKANQSSCVASENFMSIQIELHANEFSNMSSWVVHMCKALLTSFADVHFMLADKVDCRRCCSCENRVTLSEVQIAHMSLRLAIYIVSNHFISYKLEEPMNLKMTNLVRLSFGSISFVNTLSLIVCVAISSRISIIIWIFIMYQWSVINYGKLPV